MPLKCDSPLPLRVLCPARDLFLIYPEVPFSLKSVDKAPKRKQLANMYCSKKQCSITISGICFKTCILSKNSVNNIVCSSGKNNISQVDTMNK